MNRQEQIEQEALRMFERPDSSADNSTKLEALSARGIFISGAQFADSLDRWVKVEDSLPEHGVCVLGFSEKWVDEDFNPTGVRECYVDQDGAWASTEWDNDQDSWHTHSEFWCEAGSDFNPSHWMNKPSSPTTK